MVTRQWQHILASAMNDQRCVTVETREIMTGFVRRMDVMEADVLVNGNCWRHGMEEAVLLELLDEHGRILGSEVIPLCDVRSVTVNGPEEKRRHRLYITACRGYAPGLRSVTSVIRQLRSDPASFLGAPSLLRLCMHLQGYEMACRDADPAWLSDFDWKDFADFAAACYGVNAAGSDACSLITARFADDGSALAEFFRLYDLYFDE